MEKKLQTNKLEMIAATWNTTLYLYTESPFSLYFCHQASSSRCHIFTLVSPYIMMP